VLNPMTGISIDLIEADFLESEVADKELPGM
jgi:hypothetical protein